MPTKRNQNSIDWRSDTHSLRKYQFIYHFLPHPVEKRRATLLLNQSFFIYCLMLFSLGVLFRLLPVYLPGVLGYASNITMTDLLNFTNKRREEAGLADLRINPKLSAAAEKKAHHMFKKGYWAHIAPDGTEPWDFILAEGYDYVYAGENLAKNFSNSKDVVQAWMNSPSHKQNLLNKNYTDVGFASVDGVLNGYKTTIVVQMFGKPRSTQATAPVYQRQREVPVAENSPVKTIESQVVQEPKIYEEISVNPVIDIRKATKVLSVLFAGFIIVLLLLDLWYSRKFDIIKINGHTLAHITFLVLVILSIWFVLKPGSIL